MLNAVVLTAISVPRVTLQHLHLPALSRKGVDAVAGRSSLV
jgi:hypothetical protein